MPERTYNLNYTSANADMLAKTAQVDAALRSLDATATALQAKLKAMFSGIAPPANAAAKSFQGLGNQLGVVSTNAAAAQNALSGMGTSAAAVPAAVNPATASTKQFVGAMVGMQVARQALHAVLDASKQIEERWQKLAEEAISFRDSMRELANIKGEEGPGNKTYADTLRLALETDTTAVKALAASQEYENIGPTVREKGHYKPAKGQGTPEELEHNVLVEAIRTGRRYGLEEGAAGQAVGQVGMYHEIASPEAAMTQMGMAMVGLSKGKLHYTQGIIALNKAAAKLVDPKDEELLKEGARPGKIGSYGEAGIFLGAMSLGTGTAENAQHKMVQISRALNPTREKAIAGLKEAGITDEMDDPRRLIQLAKYMKAKKIQDPIAWMEKRKIGSEATRESVRIGMLVSDVLEKRLGEGAEGKKGDATGREVIAANARFRQRQQTSVDAQARVAKDVMDKVEGEQVAALDRAKAFAEERMRLKDPTYRNPVKAAFLWAASPITQIWSGQSGGEWVKEQHEKFGAIPTLRKEAAKVGVDVDKQFPGINAQDVGTRGQAFAAAARAVQEKGGDPYGRAGVMQDIKGRVDAIPGQGGDVAAPGRAAGVGGAAAPAAAGEPVTSTDSTALRIQIEQLAALKRIQDNTSGGGGGSGGLAMNPIGFAPVPGGSVRIGES